MTSRGRRPGTVVGGDERGDTLVELLITVVLLGVAFTAVTASYFTAASAAQQVQERTRVSIFLQTWAEAVLAPKSAGGADTYFGCTPPDAPPPPVRVYSGQVAWDGPTGPATAQVWTNSLGWKATMTTTYLASGNSNWQQPTFGSGCGLVNQSGVDRDAGLQRVVLHVETGDASSPTKDGLVVYRRDARCPTESIYNNPDRGPC